jgi:hypothetical protein
MKNIAGKLILCLLFFTGCGGGEYTYVYLKPDVHATSIYNPVVLAEMDLVRNEGFLLNVGLQKHTVRVAGLTDIFVNRAYAFSPSYKYITPAEPITDIRVLPLYSYGSVTAGTDISSTCIFLQTRNDTLTETEVINMLNNDVSERFSESLLDKVLIMPHISITTSITQQFVIELITEKNSRLADTTLPVVLVVP